MLQKQYDQNFVDSGSVLQVLRQQAAPESSLLDVDAEANILAEIDEDSYREAVLSDADRILHKFLLPMSFPWNEYHSYSEVIKSFPRDIDEMPDILGMEDSSHVPFENGLFGYGKFEVGKSMKSLASTENQQGRRSAARRTEDVGVIELTIVDAPENMVPSHSDIATPMHAVQKKDAVKSDAHFDSRPRRSTRKRKSSTLEHLQTEEVALHTLSAYFSQYQITKKAKIDFAVGNVQKKFVSVRFGSVSSRNSILDADIHPWTGSTSTSNSVNTDSPNKTALVLVTARLPLEVQGGRFLIFPFAEENAKRLGSYDIRYGMPPNIEINQKHGNRAKRVYTGRTRLMWTKAHFGDNLSGECSSSKQRVAYSSILTSDRVDISLFRRPREVTLTVRVNGARLVQKRTDSTASSAMKDRSLDDTEETVAEASRLSSKTISDAVNEACGAASARPSTLLQPAPAQPEQSVNSGPVRGEPVCFLRMDKFIDSLL